MSRRMMASAAFVLVGLAVVGFAQPPVDPATKGKTPPPAPKAADPLDSLIGAALVHDADVKLAQAKLQLAEAELARARQQVSQKVAVLNATIQEQKKLVALAEEQYKLADKLYKSGQGPFVDALQ